MKNDAPSCTMSKDLQAKIAEHSPHKADNLQWARLVGGGAFDYPIDYWVAVLGADMAKGTADFLVQWEPDAYCHFHKHLGRTTVLVLDGEHHVVEETPTETVHKTRKPGHLTRNPPGDVHMEYGGKQGSLLLFCMQADDGVLFEFLDRTGAVLRTITVEDFALRRI
jgi:hypothetical protein